MTIITNGDSWTFGSEILDPGLEDRINDYDKENDAYRIPKIWPTKLGKLLNKPVENISWPGSSNDWILRTTIEHIVSNYIVKNKDTSDLLVIIGWSSPERREVFVENQGWEPLRPLDNTNMHTNVEKLFEVYVKYGFHTPHEYWSRFIRSVHYLESFLTMHKIKFVTFNAFYQDPGKGIHDWNSINISDHILPADLHIWKTINSKTFIGYNDNTTFKNFIDDNIDIKLRYNGWHPSPLSHTAWAGYLMSYIKNYL